MVQQLKEVTRRARKQHRCGMCSAAINPSDLHRVSTNLYDGRVYDWRECLPCDRDVVVNLVHDWTGGYHDEGVGFEQACEWAEEAVEWPLTWDPRPSHCRVISGSERLAARNWLARAAGGEGE